MTIILLREVLLEMGFSFKSSDSKQYEVTSLYSHSIKADSDYTPSFWRQEIPSEQNCIGLVRFCSIGSKIELTAT